MSISYRFSKKELILMLDLFGNPDTLEQKFGNVFIDREEYEKTAEKLSRKGFVTLRDGTICADSGLELIIRNIYSAGYVFADQGASYFIYRGSDFSVCIRAVSDFGFEYRVSGITDAEDVEELEENISGLRFSILRGGSGETDSSEIFSFSGDAPDEHR